jgi:hypothetical protein
MQRAIAAAILLSVTLAGGAAYAQYQRQDDDRRGHYEGRRSQATFFEHDDFGGRRITLDRPRGRLDRMGWDDKISSIGLDGGPWEVCEDDRFEGRCVVIDHPVARLGDIGLDDKISSVRPLHRRRDR